MEQKHIRKVFLICGIFSPLLYLATDILASNLYKNYSFRDQAISELFAIGAPTSHIVVPLFTISSILFLVYALGIWLSSEKNRKLRLLAIMVLGNAINSIILWNFFPMHMRGDQTGFTDIMHTILAINPFIHISIIIGVINFKNWFRYYSIFTIFLLIIPAVISLSNISLLLAHQSTPWMGIAERVSVYDHQAWHAILAIVFINEYTRKNKALISNPMAIMEVKK